MAVHPELLQLMADSRLNWEVRRGGKHVKLMLDGRLVTILPSDGGRRREHAGRAHLNCVCAIRRAIRRKREAG